MNISSHSVWRVLAANRFLQNIGWMGASEILIRLSRLVTAIVIARSLSAVEFGMVALVLAADDLIRVITRNGIGAKIVQSPSSEFASVCEAAYRLNWLVSGVLCAVQVITALLLAHFYDQETLAWMLITLATVYLVYPLSMVQVYRVQRRNQLKTTAMMVGLQVGLDNLLTAALAYSGFGVWSVVLPKIVVAPVWVWLYRRFDAWRPRSQAEPAGLKPILAFSKDVLGVEILKALRANADRLLIGWWLGLEVLGIYYFAANAGLGISLSLIAAFNTALFPQLCQANRSGDALRARFRLGLGLLSVIVVPLIVLQIVSAPLYVPLIFGDRWMVAIPVLMLLCASAIPRAFAEATSQLLRAIGKTHVDLYWNAGFTLLFIVAVIGGMAHGLTGIAQMILLIHVLALIPFCLWAAVIYVPVSPRPQVEIAR